MLDNPIAPFDLFVLAVMMVYFIIVGRILVHLAMVGDLMTDWILAKLFTRHCLGTVMLYILLTYWEEYAGMSYHGPPRRDKPSNRKSKRNRRGRTIKDHWFKRKVRQKAHARMLAKLNQACAELQQPSTWLEPTAEEREVEWLHFLAVNWNKYLHISSCAQFYEELCSQSSDPEAEFKNYCAAETVNMISTLFQSTATKHLAFHITELIDSVTNGVLRTAYWCDQDDPIPIIFDSGASISVSPVKEDFINLNTGGSHDLSGLTCATQIEGTGTVEWTVMDDHGKSHKIVTEAYYVPKARVHLFSTFPYFKHPENKGGNGAFVVNDQGASFYWPNSGAIRSFEMSQSNLPVAYPKQSASAQAYTASVSDMACPSVLDESNIHLDNSQKQLLLLHQRFGHFNMHWIQNLMHAKSGEEHT